MAHPILMPMPGQMTEECTVVAWHKREGDPVHRGDVLFEIETDKSNMDVEAFDDGVLLRILVGEGRTVPVNTVCAYVGQPGEALPEDEATPEGGTVPEARSGAEALPEAVPGRGAVPGGQGVPEAVPETGSSSVPLPVAPMPATEALLASAAAPGRSALSEPPAAAATPGMVAEAPPPPAGATASARHAPLSPRAARLAGRLGIDPASLAGSGPNGRIVERDVRTAAAARDAAGGPTEGALATAHAEGTAGPAGATAAPTPPPPARAAATLAPARPLAVATPSGADQPIDPDALELAGRELVGSLGVEPTGPGGRVTRADVERALRERPRPLSRMRQVIAQRLTESFTTTPHFAVTVAVDMTALLALREELKSMGRDYSVTDFISMAVVRSLVEFPPVNGRTDGRQVWLRERVDLGLAVALEAGLVVPVVRSADRMRMAELHERSAAVVAAARAGRLSPDQMTGSTFTISNMGMLGVEHFTAIINPGEAAILAVSSTVPTPVVVGDGVGIRKIMRMTLSADHRIVDGALAAAFLDAVRRRLEDAELVRAESAG